MNDLKTSLSEILPDSKPWAIWIWNLLISREEALTQLKSLIEKGFGGAAIKPGRDMNPKFLTREFFTLLESVLEHAKANDFGIRIALDFSLPWNTGVDAAVTRSEDLRAVHLFMEHEEIVKSNGLVERNIDHPESAVLYAIRLKNNKMVLSDSRRITLPANTRVLSWRAPKGYDYKILILRKKYCEDPVAGYTPNLLYPKMANVYVQNVLEPIYKRYSRFCGTTLKGLLTEIPFAVPTDTTVLWDDDLVVKYRAKYKKDLFKLLPCLFGDVDDEFVKNRGHIYNFLHQSLYERFALVLEGWARKNRMSQWTLCGERTVCRCENLFKEVLAVPEAPLMVTGLENQDGTLENYAALCAMADLNANQFHRETITVLGRNRTGMAASIQDLKNEADSTLLIGPTRFIIDGCYFNLDQRSSLKTPCNPFWYAPDWQQMHHLCSYLGRIRQVVSGMVHQKDVAVMIPGESLLSDYLPSNMEPIRRGAQMLRRITDELQTLSIGFEMVSEERMLRCATQETGEFILTSKGRKTTFKILIVPYSRLISKGVLVLFERLVAKKCTVLVVDDMPSGDLETGPGKSFTDRIERMKSSKRGTMRAVAAADLAAALAALRPSLAVRMAEKNTADICARTAVAANKWNLYVVRNASERVDSFVTVDFPADKTLLYLDCEKGEAVPPLHLHEAENGQSLSFTIAPLQTCIFAGSAQKAPAFDKAEVKKHPLNLFASVPRNYRIVLKDQWQFSAASLNVLPLASWNTRIGLSKESGGYSLFYEGTFFVKELPRECFLSMNGFTQQPYEYGEIVKTCEVTINGNVLTQAGPAAPAPGQPPAGMSDRAPYLREESVYTISETIVKGVNRISVRTFGFASRPPAIVYPPVILGDFAISKGPQGWVIDTNSQSMGYESWTVHGFPCMSGFGTYKNVIEVPSQYERLILRTSKSTGVMKIAINGTSLGTFAFQPIEQDVTSLCNSRRNEIQVTVANTVDNYLHMNGRVSGLLGEMYLDVY